MKTLGAKVEWNGDKTSIQIECNNKEYILNTTNHTLIERGNNNLIIAPIAGGQTIFKIIGNELVIDDNSMSQYVKLMGAKINIDYEKSIINIE